MPRFIHQAREKNGKILLHPFPDACILVANMHELAATDEILARVLEQAQRAGALRVVRVRMVKGCLNDYVDETLQWLFATMSESTIAAGAEVVLRHVPIRFQCKDCGLEFIVERDDFHAACQTCGSIRTELIAGREFFLESIEVE